MSENGCMIRELKKLREHFTDQSRGRISKKSELLNGLINRVYGSVTSSAVDIDVCGPGASLYVKEGTERLTLRFFFGEGQFVDLPMKPGISYNFPFNRVQIVSSDPTPVTQSYEMWVAPMAHAFEALGMPHDAWFNFSLPITGGTPQTGDIIQVFDGSFDIRFEAVYFNMTTDANVANRLAIVKLVDPTGAITIYHAVAPAVQAANAAGVYQFGVGEAARSIAGSAATYYHAPLPDTKLRNFAGQPSRLTLSVDNAQVGDAITDGYVTGAFRGRTEDI